MPFRQPPQVLIICGRNKRRSRTAETLYRRQEQIRVRSAGLSPQSPHQVNEKDLAWAHLILVMETGHRSRLQAMFPGTTWPPIEVLHIPDEYEYMDEELVAMFNTCLPPLLAQQFQLK